jgi:hypothetical protein
MSEKKEEIPTIEGSWFYGYCEFLPENANLRDPLLLPAERLEAEKVQRALAAKERREINRKQRRATRKAKRIAKKKKKASKP